MEQITIFDILQQQETEPEQVGPHDWRPIRSGVRIGLTKFMPLVYPVTDHDTKATLFLSVPRRNSKNITALLYIEAMQKAIIALEEKAKRENNRQNLIDSDMQSMK